MEERVIMYEAPFGGRIDEEPARERIDRAWMAETAPAEYAKASGEHSNYLGCTYKEGTLRDIHPRAMAWFAADGGEAAVYAEGMETDSGDFNADLRWFFANVQANFYCKALEGGMDGKRAMEAASDALEMVAEPYRERMSEWNDGIGAD